MIKNPKITRLQSLLKPNEALLVASNANIFYLSETFFRGYIFVPEQGDTINFIIRPNNITPSSSNIYIRKPEQIPEILKENGIKIPEKIGFENGVLPYSDIVRLQKIFTGCEHPDCTQTLRDARMVKTAGEIELMRIDGQHQASAYSRITRIYRENMTDLEFQIEIERILRLEGCLGFIRTAGNLMEINMGSVISGDNADTPTPYDFSMGGRGISKSLPVGADGTTIRPGTTVMVDMNGSFNGYQTDMTRVWRLGEIPEIAYKAHQCSCRILHTLETEARPGMPVSELYRMALQIVEEENLQKYFMGHKQQVGFIGHGVGIELNEQPPITARNHTPLLENMTLAIEPKFVIPGVGAVGNENTYVVKPDGLESLTVFPEEIQEL